MWQFVLADIWKRGKLTNIYNLNEWKRSTTQQNVTLRHLARGFGWDNAWLGEREWQQQRGSFGCLNREVQEQRGSVASYFVTHAPKTFKRGNWQHIAPFLPTLWTQISKRWGAFTFQNVCGGPCSTTISAQFGRTLFKRRKLHNTNSYTYHWRHKFTHCCTWGNGTCTEWHERRQWAKWRCTTHKHRGLWHCLHQCKHISCVPARIGHSSHSTMYKLAGKTDGHF